MNRVVNRWGIASCYGMVTVSVITNINKSGISLRIQPSTANHTEDKAGRVINMSEW